jgi:hypothetical protein
VEWWRGTRESLLGVRVRLSEEAVIAGECYLLFEHRIEPCRVVSQAPRAAGLLFVNFE